MSGLEYIYLIHDRYARDGCDHVFKVGRTLNFKTRSRNYNKFSTAFIVAPVYNSKQAETAILKEFRTRFKARTDAGVEWFDGDPNEMVKIILEYSLGDVSRCNFKNTTGEKAINYALNEDAEVHRESTCELITLVHAVKSAHELYDVLSTYTRETLVSAIPPIGSIMRIIEESPQFKTVMHYKQRRKLDEMLNARPHLDSSTAYDILTNYIHKIPSDAKFTSVLTELLWLIYRSRVIVNGVYATREKNRLHFTDALTVTLVNPPEIATDKLAKWAPVIKEETLTLSALHTMYRNYNPSGVLTVALLKETGIIYPFKRNYPWCNYEKLDECTIGLRYRPIEYETTCSVQWAASHATVYVAWCVASKQYAALNRLKKLIISPDTDPVGVDLTGWTMTQLCTEADIGIPQHLSYIKNIRSMFESAGYTRYAPAALAYISD